MGAERTALAARFAGAARVYWLSVFPTVRRELRCWLELAHELPESHSRELALSALAKRGNMEGAAAFATFVPRAQRASVVRATVAFQTAYNYLDVLSERSGSGGAAESRRLHEPLLMALAPAAGGHAGATDDGYLDGPARATDDGYPDGRAPATGDCYLDALMNACHRALDELPSYGVAAPYALRAAERVLAYQAFAAARSPGEGAAMERWARECIPAGSGLAWWEGLAAAGSSLGVHATIAAAATPRLDARSAAVLEEGYFPWIAALHSLLDHLIDVEEDARTGQPDLIACYSSAEEAAARMRLLAERALESARALSSSGSHELIVAAMASSYLASPQAKTAEAAPVAEAVLDALGPLAKLSMLVFRARGELRRGRPHDREPDQARAGRAGARGPRQREGLHLSR